MRYKKPLTPMQLYIQRACRAKDIRKIVLIYKHGSSVDTLVTTALWLALHFSEQKKYKAAFAMVRRARLHAADEYERLLWINVIDEIIRRQRDGLIS